MNKLFNNLFASHASKIADMARYQILWCPKPINHNPSGGRATPNLVLVGIQHQTSITGGLSTGATVQVCLPFYALFISVDEFRLLTLCAKQLAATTAAQQIKTA